MSSTEFDTSGGVPPVEQVAREILEIGMGAPTVRCGYCGDPVVAKAVIPPDGGESTWVYPIDERGWCGDCVLMEQVDDAIARDGRWSPLPERPSYAPPPVTPERFRELDGLDPEPYMHPLMGEDVRW